MKYRVSHVEAFRKWEADPDADDDALAELIRNIRGEGQPSERMLAGTALHKAFEFAEPDVCLPELSADGYTFVFTKDMEVHLAAVREVRASKRYLVDGASIIISGQVDQIDGRRIEDHKSTGRFDPERYLEGFQWRLYLDIFDADHFRWNVFEIAETDELKRYEVFAQHTLEQYRYPALEADCHALVTRFARFVRSFVEVASAPARETV